MREARAVTVFADALRRGGDWAPFEIYPLVALGQIGGSDAEAVLRAYLDGPARAHVIDALEALQKIDAAQARVRAQALLNDPARKLTPSEREELEKIVAAG
jgi:hypothetical protein